MTRLTYWYREYSEVALERPAVHVFGSETEARKTMITEAYEAEAALGEEAWVATELDGDMIAIGEVPDNVTQLHVHYDNSGAVDSFYLEHQDVPLPPVWVAITYDDESNEMDCSLHDTEADAQSAVLTELAELYGHHQPPEEYDPAAITSWLAENLLKFSWSIRPKDLPA